MHIFRREQGHQDCMQHCEKISDGRSPAVIDQADWESLTQEIELITEDRSDLPTNYIWLSVTEGDKNSKLARLDHWPETEVFENKTMKLEAVEAIWRDFYTGTRLSNWTNFKVTYDIDHTTGVRTKNDAGNDAVYGDSNNCLSANAVVEAPPPPTRAPSSSEAFIRFIDSFIGSIWMHC